MYVLGTSRRVFLQNGLDYYKFRPQMVTCGHFWPTIFFGVLIRINLTSRFLHAYINHSEMDYLFRQILNSVPVDEVVQISNSTKIHRYWFPATAGSRVCLFFSKWPNVLNLAVIGYVYSAIEPKPREEIGKTEYATVA